MKNVIFILLFLFIMSSAGAQSVQGVITSGDWQSIVDDQSLSWISGETIGSSVSEKQISLQDIPAGLYYIQLIRGKLVNVYKVVKL
jgi:hypothetical protein